MAPIACIPTRPLRSIDPYRARRDYRRNPKHTYRIGYVESRDGLDWIRKDEVVGIDLSEEGWDS
jgi:hypothetical protein